MVFFRKKSQKNSSTLGPTAATGATGPSVLGLLGVGCGARRARRQARQAPGVKVKFHHNQPSQYFSEFCLCPRGMSGASKEVETMEEDIDPYADMPPLVAMSGPSKEVETM